MGARGAWDWGFSVEQDHTRRPVKGYHVAPVEEDQTRRPVLAHVPALSLPYFPNKFAIEGGEFLVEGLIGPGRIVE